MKKIISLQLDENEKELRKIVGTLKKQNLNLLANLYSENLMKINKAIHKYLCFDFAKNDLRLEIENAMKYSTNGGKRIRPMMALASYKMLNPKKKDFSAILPVISGIEMVHGSSLIHDDLPAMDNDELRRGKPSCWKKFKEDMAILAGDNLMFYSFEIMANDLPKYFKTTNILKTLVYLYQAYGVKGMVGGQVLDIRGEKKKDFKYLQEMHAGKTGAAIRAAIVTPAILKGEKKELIQLLEQFGNHLGQLFQIVDDIIDTTHTSAELGKTPGKDAEQNKLTYVTFFGLEGSRQKAREVKAKAEEVLEKLQKKGYNTKLFEEILKFVILQDSK